MPHALTRAALAGTVTAAALIPAALPAAADTPGGRPAAGPTAGQSAGQQPARPSSGRCSAGQLCLWERPRYGGPRTAHELSDTDIESCVPLPAGTSAGSLANRTGRPVTTYQSAECGETGEFDTYPGGGTWVPQSPYRVRAFKTWEH